MRAQREPFVLQQRFLIPHEMALISFISSTSPLQRPPSSDHCRIANKTPQREVKKEPKRAHARAP